MKMGSPEGNSYSMHPQDVRMDTAERDQFADDVHEAINEAFVFANHSETVASIKPLELRPMDYNGLYEALTSSVCYNRAYVEATFDRSNDGTTLRGATVRLRNEYIKSMHVDLFIKAGDDVDEFKKEDIDPEDPLFYIDAPVNAYTLKRERMYLNYMMCRDLLNHIVTLANPIAAITNSNRSLTESIEALTAISEATSVSRSTKYQFRTNDDETLIVDVHDRGYVESRKDPVASYHEVNIQKIRSFGRAGTLATSMHVTTSKHEVNATLNKEYTYSAGAADDIAARQTEVAEAYQSLSADTPQEFGRQVLDSIYRLSSVMVNADEVEQLEF